MATHDYDVVVIGAGIGGLYATHRLRNEFGLSVHGYERARDVGGVWLWNCYPGARVDMEAKDYAYRFSPELRQEWQWSELFPAQPEILSYLGHVADRFDLRRDFTFNTSVTSLIWDAGSAIWIVNTSDGNTTRARFIIAAPGSMSAPKQPEFPVTAATTIKTMKVRSQFVLLWGTFHQINVNKATHRNSTTSRQLPL